MDKRRKNQITLWLSLGVLVAAIIAALVIYFVPTTTDETAPRPPATVATPAATVEANGVGCEAPESDTRTVPDDLRWAASQGVTWPVSDTVGPTTTTDGLPACFEHSPIGAALAAVTYLYAQVDHTPLETTEFYVMDSPGKTEWLSQLEPETPSQLKAQLESNGVSLVGFQIEEYGADRAAVRLVLRVPGSATGLRGLPFPMQWVDGDWKVKPLDRGSTGQATDVDADDLTYWTAAA